MHCNGRNAGPPFPPQVAPASRQPTGWARREADRLLQTILKAGEPEGRDAAGRLVIRFAVGRHDFERADGVRHHPRRGAARKSFDRERIAAE
jgi:hypothetical protein